MQEGVQRPRSPGPRIQAARLVRALGYLQFGGRPGTETRIDDGDNVHSSGSAGGSSLCAKLVARM